MIIYNYDPTTTEYTFSCEASLDPQETINQGIDIYLIPDYATTVKPPKTKTNEICVFDDGWKIEADFRGKYIVNEDMDPYIVDKIGSIPEGYIVITDNQAAKIEEDDLYYVISDGKLIRNPHYEEDKQAREDAAFNRQFFPTSLGYVRRQVSMKDGSTKDFLSDILPLLQVNVPILTYTRQLEQSKVLVTEEFLAECKQQLLVDFYGV